MQTTIDFAAVARVSKRTELKGIRLTEVLAKCDPKVPGPLEPKLDLDCAVFSQDESTLEIACNYRFAARSQAQSEAEGSQAAEAEIKYLLLYELQGTEPLAEADLAQFALGNGTLHSWPFVREFLYGLTSRMGYPPYTLPVMHFIKPAEPKAVAEKTEKNMTEAPPKSPA